MYNNFIDNTLYRNLKSRIINSINNDSNEDFNYLQELVNNSYDSSQLSTSQYDNLCMLLSDYTY